MRWHVYILECENDTLYTGITNDVQKRFDKHLDGKGARYTRFNKPTKILYTKSYKNKSIAFKRELEVKSWPRKKKLQLINGEVR